MIEMSLKDDYFFFISEKERERDGKHGGQFMVSYLAQIYKFGLNMLGFDLKPHVV